MTVTRPEPSEGNRLVVLAGDRESGDTCRTFVFHKESHAYIIWYQTSSGGDDGGG